MIQIPDSVQQFIEAAIVVEDICLPFHYPKVDELEAFQSGYRYHGVTLENLVADKAGAWQPGWYVVAQNGMDDPFIVDFSDAAQGFPVYYAAHGTGRWDVVQIADNLAMFSSLLTALKARYTNKEETLQYLQAHTDKQNVLWQEVYDNVLNRDDTPIEPVDMTEWIWGEVVITEVGAQKMKVVHYLKDIFKLTPQEALAMVKQPEITVKHGVLLHLKRGVRQLESIGATAVFRADEVQP